MGDRALHLALAKVLYADSHLVEQIRNDLGWLTTISPLRVVVESCRDDIWVDVLRATCTDHFINTILNDRKLTSVENHADLRV